MGFIFVTKKLYCFCILRKLFRILGPFNFVETIGTLDTSSTRNVEILMRSACAEDTFPSAIPISHSTTNKKQIKIILGIQNGLEMIKLKTMKYIEIYSLGILLWLAMSTMNKLFQRNFLTRFSQ